jgi:hypothetical protein
MRFLPILVLVAGCGASRPGPEVPAGEQAFDDLSRDELNLLALRLDLPLFWAADADGDRSVDAGEVRELLFYPSEGRWVSDGELTPQFVAAYDAMVRAKSAPPPESVRERLLLHELGTAAIAVVETDLRSLPEEHRQFAERMLAVARLIDALYAKQVGMAALAARLEGASAPSRSVFRRNWGPECLSPAMERNTACSAIEGAPKRYVDVYPETLQRQDGFCAAIEARPDGEALLDPFVAVRERNGAPVPVPYHEVYGAEMTAIAAELDAAAGALADPNEESLRVYLRAAAASFRSNDWLAADEAWSRMNAESSRWYLRVAPDETYWDPCSRKAGFHLTLALVDRASLEWQRLLTPFQDDMERAIASLNERVYTARDVSFHMPDFIAIAINAGDDRTAFGATIGQSLPNWGRVADEGWRRTVAMANLYTDADSEARRRQVAESLFTTGSLAHYSASSEPGLMSTVLHEATHNLGPSHDHRLNGRTNSDAFGGELATMLEELKAQTGALFYLEFLVARGAITRERANETFLDSLIWALGHVSEGMYTADGQRKPYSQLSAVQIGWLLEHGALTFDAGRPAANARDRGSFAIDLGRLPAASEGLMREVIRITATQDRPAAESLAARYVDGTIVPHVVVSERYGRIPRQSFVYSFVR